MYIKWQERDGLHSSYTDEEHGTLLLAMIEDDPSMQLIEVRRG